MHNATMNTAMTRHTALGLLLLYAAVSTAAATGALAAEQASAWVASTEFHRPPGLTRPCPAPRCAGIPLTSPCEQAATTSYDQGSYHHECRGDGDVCARAKQCCSGTCLRHTCAFGVAMPVAAPGVRHSTGQPADNTPRPPWS